MTTLLSGLDHVARVEGAPALPEEPAPVHAVASYLPVRAPDFAHHARAACGIWTQVVLPAAFRADDPDSCAECVHRLQRGAPAHR